MRPLAVLLSLAVAAQAAAAPSTMTVAGVEPITVTAARPVIDPAEIPTLKTARAAGAVAGGMGVGLMSYVVFFSAGGPFGWAAALIFVGGMTAYLSHRRLQDRQDFPPTPRPAPPPAPSPSHS
ncbi:MAG: hypothetical protein A2V88_04225 [Elusimicrobia bacterium RBG_16_66_12]|nr:MAG: hypothetical protein A2V88_04225 [Elusimicrobia bacterium RBG_16_66_12]